MRQFLKHLWDATPHVLTKRQRMAIEMDAYTEGRDDMLLELLPSLWR
ncbi:hypothetical protein ABKW28_10770 [Nocardioides sp. 31GB23]